MKECHVRRRAFAMPLTSPAYPPGPYRFCQREYLIIAYRTDEKKLRQLVPEPLQIDEPGSAPVRSIFTSMRLRRSPSYPCSRCSRRPISSPT
jgi:acetoacetate decarboxylase